MPTDTTFKPTKNPDSFWNTLGFPARGEQLFRALHDGFPFEVFNKLAKVSGLDNITLALSINIKPAALKRRAKAGSFNIDESDKLYRIAEVFKAALDLFENDQKAAQIWIQSKVRGLGYKRPIEMLSTTAETEAVLNLIGRLEHSVFI